MENYKDVLLAFIDKLNEAANTATEFAKQQIPDVLDQLLMWHFAESLILFVVSLTIFAFSVFGMTRWISHVKNETDFSGSDACDGLFFGSAILGVFSFFCILSNLQWLKIWIAPKLYLLEYGAELAGKASGGS